MSTSAPALDTEFDSPAAGPALGATVARRLSTIDVLPELRQRLLRLVAADEHWSARRWQWGWVIPAAQAALGGSSLPIEPFVAAWALMYAAIVRLDQLQDGDPVDNPLPIAGHGAAQYNLLLAYYVLASSLLDDLSSEAFSSQRICALHRLWSDMMLRTASGQQRDLIIGDGNGAAGLTSYQDLAQAKTGSTFALAFGGTATLLTDDQTVINTCLVVGDLFGTLVQYHDDILDADVQPNLTLTLPGALAQTHPGIAASGRTPQDFWAYVYYAYRAAAERALADLPNDIGARILGLFVRAFERVADGQGDAA